TEHRLQRLHLVPVERRIEQRSRKVSRRRPRRSKAHDLAALQRAAAVVLDQLAIGDPHRHFEHSWPSHISRDAHKLHSWRSRPPEVAIPLATLAEDRDCMRESLHVVQRRRLTPQAGVDRPWRLIARLGAVALNGFHQRRLFAADVAAGGDEDCKVEVHARPQNVASQQPHPANPCQFFTQYFGLQLVLVPDVEIALLRADDGSCHHHALKHHVRQVLQDEAVFDRSGFALVRVADDKFLRPARLLRAFPLDVGGKARAAHAAQFALLQQRQRLVEVLQIDQPAIDAVLLGLRRIRVALDFDAALRGTAWRHIRPVDTRGENLLINVRDDRLEVRALVIVLVDADHGSVVAAPDAGNIAHLHNIGRAGVLMLQRMAKLASAVEVAAHVVAHAHIDAYRRLQPEVWIIARDAVHVLDGHAATDGDACNLVGRDEPNVLLNMAQVFEHTQLVAAGFDLHEDFRRYGHSGFFLATRLTAPNSGLAQNLADGME